MHPGRRATSQSGQNPQTQCVCNVTLPSFSTSNLASRPPSSLASVPSCKAEGPRVEVSARGHTGSRTETRAETGLRAITCHYLLCKNHTLVSTCAPCVPIVQAFLFISGSAWMLLPSHEGARPAMAISLTVVLLGNIKTMTE